MPGVPASLTTATRSPCRAKSTSLGTDVSRLRSLCVTSGCCFRPTPSLRRSGAVTLASVMTFRQFLSVVISCFLFGAPLSFLQWAGLLMVLAPVADRVMLERSKPEVFGKSPGGAKTRGGEGEHDDVDASPRAGDGFGPIAVPGQIPDDYFSARGTGHTPRSSVNYSPRSSENFSPRSSVSEGPFARAPSDAASDERSRLVRK